MSELGGDPSSGISSGDALILISSLESYRFPNNGKAPVANRLITTVR
jgi:hypothetical protein